MLYCLCLLHIRHKSAEVGDGLQNISKPIAATSDFMAAAATRCKSQHDKLLLSKLIQTFACAFQQQDERMSPLTSLKDHVVNGIKGTRMS